MTDQKIRAFTIVELLVVVTIIGILAAAVTVSVLGFRAQSRDSRRAADSNTMEKTLAAYYADYFEYPDEYICDSSYGSDNDNVFPPTPGCPPVGTGTSNPLGAWDKSSTFYQSLVPKYISTLPVDPINDIDPDPVNGMNYYYQYEPSNNPKGECFFWQYWDESGGRTSVRNDIGDLSYSSSTPKACDF